MGRAATGDLSALDERIRKGWLLVAVLTLGLVLGRWLVDVWGSGATMVASR